MEQFADLVLSFVRDYGGSKGAFAKATGMTQSQLSRYLRSDPERPPQIEHCLRIAQVAHYSASRLLRLAGRADIADLIEDLFGTAAERRLAANYPEIKPFERELIRALRALPRQEQRCIVFLTERMASKPSPSATSAKARKSAKMKTETSESSDAVQGFKLSRKDPDAGTKKLRQWQQKVG